MIARAAALGRTGRSMVTLARWLGPWAGDSARPARVVERLMDVPGDGPFQTRLYTPASASVRGAYVIAPGLHFDGPGDPRMDRLCRVLAAAGFAVCAPFIADFMRLCVTERAHVDFARAIDAFMDTPEYPRGAQPWIFSISFGSSLALRAAASPAHADAIGALVLFGGYADHRAVMRFCLSGGAAGEPHDPLNGPVVFIHLVDGLLAQAGLDPANAPALHAAWLMFARRTWSRPDRAKVVESSPIAEDLARTVAPAVRPLFLMGTGAVPGGPAACERAFERFRDQALDVAPHLGQLRCPVHIVHGADDDVIPPAQAQELAQAMPARVACRVYMTGLYGHTASHGWRRVVPALGREVATLGRLLRVLAQADELTRRSGTR